MFPRSRPLLLAVICCGFSFLILYACKHDLPLPKTLQVEINDGNYPTAVNKIFITRCAIAGCHNAASYQNSDGLQLDTWDHLFNGSSHGAVIIPYDVENSSLLQFINLDHTLGHVATPTMPLNDTPLSRDEFLTMRDWVAAGAPDKNGNIPFASDPDTRQKIYIGMRGCDIISVIDAGRKVIMRNVPVGKKPLEFEAPFCVRVSPDGRYVYISFTAGDYVQKIDARTDAIVGETDISAGTPGQWNMLYISPDGSRLIAADFQNGIFKIINTATMQVVQQIPNNGLFYNPNSIAANPSFDTFYVASRYGNVVYKITLDGALYRQVSIDGGPPNFNSGSRDPYAILMSPDHSMYFVSCDGSNEVRVMDAHADTVISFLSMPGPPQEMAMSRTKPFLFVSCPEAVSPQSGFKGVVVVINYQTLQKVATINGSFYQPYGLAVDDRDGLFYIASSDTDTGGVVAHHQSACPGRNGWYNVYDLNTLQPANDSRYETSVAPWSADIRFK